MAEPKSPQDQPEAEDDNKGGEELGSLEAERGGEGDEDDDGMGEEEERDAAAAAAMMLLVRRMS